MSDHGWNRRGFMGLLLAVALVAGCNTTQFSPGAVQSVKPPVTGAAAKFGFAPIDGVPIPVLQALSGALNREAAAQRLNVVPNNDPARVYEVRGFVSAVADGQTTRLVYVWDVVDRQGVRLHRISGQQAGGKPTGSPWTGIGNQTIDLAARQTVAELSKWVGN